MSKIKYGGFDQYGAGPLEQQQFGTAGVEGANSESVDHCVHIVPVRSAFDICEHERDSEVCPLQTI